MKGGMASALIALLAVVITGGITWVVLSRPKAPPVAVVEAADTDETPASTAMNLDNLVRDAQTEEAAPAAAAGGRGDAIVHLVGAGFRV